MSENSVPSREASHAPEKAEGFPLDLKGKRAVVVEDEGVTQLQLRRILRAAGIEVVGMAANGQDAIEVVLNNRPDFVLMDVKMPVMDGLEASRQILAQKHVCIIMLTAFSEEEYQQEAQKIGVTGYILKPITAETLIPQLAAVLQKFS
jgi:two-component system, response regulator PdtaR